MQTDAIRNCRGAGVGYWDDSTEDLNAFGVHYVRHAAGLAFVESIDPSPEFQAKVKKSPRILEKGFDDFYDEKQLPLVLRYGAAAFVERYFVDTRAASRGGDANWASKWSVQNIARTGGLDPIDRILDFRISADDLDASTKLINQAGLLVCFIVRGNNEAVTEAHRAWSEAFAKGDKLKKPTEKLFDALRDEEAALRQFADQIGS